MLTVDVWNRHDTSRGLFLLILKGGIDGTVVKERNWGAIGVDYRRRVGSNSSSVQTQKMLATGGTRPNRRGQREAGRLRGQSGHLRYLGRRRGELLLRQTGRVSSREVPGTDQVGLIGGESMGSVRRGLRTRIPSGRLSRE